MVMGFEVGYVTSTGDQARLPLADVSGLRFEDAAPVRRFVSYRGQRHLSGRWWSATVGRHVGYESWLERDHVMALDSLDLGRRQVALEGVGACAMADRKRYAAAGRDRQPPAAQEIHGVPADV